MSTTATPPQPPLSNEEMVAATAALIRAMKALKPGTRKQLLAEWADTYAIRLFNTAIGADRGRQQAEHVAVCLQAATASASRYMAQANLAIGELPEDHPVHQAAKAAMIEHGVQFLGKCCAAQAVLEGGDQKTITARSAKLADEALAKIVAGQIPAGKMFVM